MDADADRAIVARQLGREPRAFGRVAVARNDRIVASIVGTAINHDGHTPAITAPSERPMAMFVMRSSGRVLHGTSQR